MPDYVVSIILHMQALVILEKGILVSRIIEYTSFSKATNFRIKKIAIEQGYNLSVSHQFKDEYFTNTPRSGWPKEISEEISDKVIKMVQKNHKGRELPSREIGFFTGILQMSTLHILKAHGLSKFEPTYKPGLTAAMKRARLKFCLEHQH